jgi:hypothetical protein
VICSKQQHALSVIRPQFRTCVEHAIRAHETCLTVPESRLQCKSGVGLQVGTAAVFMRLAAQNLEGATRGDQRSPRNLVYVITKFAGRSARIALPDLGIEVRCGDDARCRKYQDTERSSMFWAAATRKYEGAERVPRFGFSCRSSRRRLYRLAQSCPISRNTHRFHNLFVLANRKLCRFSRFDGLDVSPPRASI